MAFDKIQFMVKVEIDKICLEIIFSNLITRLVVQVMLLIQLEHGIRYIYIYIYIYRERERERERERDLTYSVRF